MHLLKFSPVISASSTSQAPLLPTPVSYLLLLARRAVNQSAQLDSFHSVIIDDESVYLVG